MARGKHLFPFRTEPLSPSAPMVLGPQGPGRVGRRRFLLVPDPADLEQIAGSQTLTGRSCRALERGARRERIMCRWTVFAGSGRVGSCGVGAVAVRRFS